MVDTFVDIGFGLRLKTFNDGLFLIKLSAIYQALEFEFFEFLFDLAEWQFYSIILWATVMILI